MNAFLKHTKCGELGVTSEDGRFTVIEVECLGACANAPMMWIDDDYFEDLTYDGTRAIVEALKRGERPASGSQSGRKASMPSKSETSASCGAPAGMTPSR